MSTTSRFSPGDLITIRLPADRETGITIYSTTSPHKPMATLNHSTALVLGYSDTHYRVRILTPNGTVGLVDEWYFTGANKNP
jgi:hypothetical protein